MHQKKIPRVKRSILHSIPILHAYCNSRSITHNYLHNNNNKLFRYLSSSIPLACMVALLLLSICTISPDGRLSSGLGLGFGSSVAYAEEGDSTSDPDAGISLLSADSSLSISTPTLNGNASPGQGTSYVSSNVTYNTTGDVENYTLRVSYANGYSSLKYDGNGGTTITGAASKTGSSMSDNTWGFGWGTTSANDSGLTYYTMPAYGSSGTGLAGGVLASGSTATSATNKLTFAAKFGQNAVAGHYKTAVLLSLTTTPKTLTRTITYNANNGTNAPASQSCTTTNTSCNITITSSKPSRSGYTFLGWSTSSTATSTDTTYDPGKNVSVSSNVTLYAVWEEEKLQLTPGFTSVSNMQAMTTSACTNAVQGAYKDLTDTRDNNRYRVVKFEDDRCWMTSNLALDLSKASLTSANSNVSTSTPLTWNSGSDTTLVSESSGFSDGTQSTAKWNNGKDSSNNNWTGYNDSYGYYYNWCAATAGSCSGATTDGAVASASICPKGWRLPTITEYETFLKAASIKFRSYWQDGSGNTIIDGSYTSSTLNNTYNFPYAGRIDENLMNNVDSDGFYWSSTHNSSATSYILELSSSGGVQVRTVWYGNRIGCSVRCIAQ